MMAVQEKVCTKCRVLKPRSEFYDSSRVNGGSHCKVCVLATQRASRSKKAIEAPALSIEAEKERKRVYYRRRRALAKLKAGVFRGDGPCWCCRAQAIGETEFRLCFACGGLK